jgi:hypothetical protein
LVKREAFCRGKNFLFGDGVISINGAQFLENKPTLDGKVLDDVDVGARAETT